MRPIDADALKDVIQQHDYPLADRLNSIDTGMFTLGIFQAIDEQPTLSPDEVRGVGEWISVEERLPDHRKRVLAIYANGVISTGRVFHNGFPEAYDGFDENGDFKAVPVTHWMPLPDPPEEDT